MASNLQDLLMYIVEHPLRQVETRSAQLDASAVQDVAAEIAAVTHEQKKAAERVAPAFAEGLRKAARGPLTVDDTSPDGNMIAEAFARYMIPTELATSQSVELPAGGFRYTFEVNWARLREVSKEAGVDLNAQLGNAEA